MKYQAIKDNPKEMLTPLEVETYKERLEQIESIKADKLAELSVTESFNTMLFVSMAATFSKVKYMNLMFEGKIYKDEIKSYPEYENFRKYQFLFRLMSTSFKLKEREIEKELGVTLAPLVKRMTSVLSDKNMESGTRKEKVNEVLTAVAEIELGMRDSFEKGE